MKNEQFLICFILQINLLYHIDLKELKQMVICFELTIHIIK